MALCSSCHQSRCLCGERAALGLPVVVVEPTGDLVSNTLGDACTSTPCSSTPEDPIECGNYFKEREGVNGDSFFYSAGGPFALPAAVVCSPSYICPPTVNLVSLPDSPGFQFQDPGALQDVICMNLPPGTYNFQERVLLHRAVPGTRLVLLYRPDCDDSSLEYAVIDCQAPCPDAANPSLRNADMSCDGYLVVPNNGCRAGFRLLVQTGCDPCISGTIPYIQNFQIILTRLTSRQLLNFNESALVSNTLTPSTFPTCVV